MGVAGCWAPGPGVVDLPGGGTVRGGSWRRRGAVVDDADHLVVLTAVRPRTRALPRSRSLSWVCWPDFAVPVSTARAVHVLARAGGRARRERVSVVCGSGVGRTGTALALLLVLDGVEVSEAVRRVRVAHHPRAVETAWQRGWLREVARRLAE